MQVMGVKMVMLGLLCLTNTAFWTLLPASAEVSYGSTTQPLLHKIAPPSPSSPSTSPNFASTPTPIAGESSQQGGQRHKSDETGEEPVQGGEGERGGQISEYVVSVSAVLETTGVDQTARQRVMGVVGRLVDRLARVEEEKDSATMQLKGEKRVKVSIMTKLSQGWQRSARDWRRSWRRGAWTSWRAGRRRMALEVVR